MAKPVIIRNRFLKLCLIFISISALVALLIVANDSEQPLAANIRADKVRVEKSKRQLTLLKNGEVIKSYRIALGREPIGHKLREGDNKTPEGKYIIDYRNPKSGYYKSLHISYPDEKAIARAKASGELAGGDVMIHGLRKGMAWVGNLHRVMDWTRGCIAVTNWEMDEIWRAVPDGTMIEINP